MHMTVKTHKVNTNLIIKIYYYYKKYTNTILAHNRNTKQM